MSGTLEGVRQQRRLGPAAATWLVVCCSAPTSAHASACMALCPTVLVLAEARRRGVEVRGVELGRLGLWLRPLMLSLGVAAGAGAVRRVRDASESRLAQKALTDPRVVE